MTATSGAATPDPKPLRSDGQWTIVFRRLRKHRIAMFCFFVLIGMLAISALAPLIAPFDRDEPNLGARFLTPMSVDRDGNMHLLGTDHLGRDYFTRLLYASRVSLGTAFFATFLASAIGITLGILAGFFGGWVDVIVSRTLEIIASMPTLVLLLIVVTVFVGREEDIPIPNFVTNIFAGFFAVQTREANIVLLVNIVLALFGWTVTARLMRGMAMSVREHIYIEASRALGASNLRILVRHVFPNALPPMIVDFTLGVNAILLAESALSFLGFGIQDPTPTWGNMLNNAQSFMFQHPWMPLIPAMPILIASLAVNYFGDGLRDALDPRQRG